MFWWWCFIANIFYWVYNRLTSSLIPGSHSGCRSAPILYLKSFPHCVFLPFFEKRSTPGNPTHGDFGLPHLLPQAQYNACPISISHPMNLSETFYIKPHRNWELDSDNFQSTITTPNWFPTSYPTQPNPIHGAITQFNCSWPPHKIFYGQKNAEEWGSDPSFLIPEEADPLFLRPRPLRFKYKTWALDDLNHKSKQYKPQNVSSQAHLIGVGFPQENRAVDNIFFH